MERRAQLIGHIIIFIIGLIVVVSILFFGYRVISKVNSDRCELQRISFGTDLSEFINRNKGWGSNKLIEIGAPCETTHVCFVDRRVTDEYGDTFSQNRPDLNNQVFEANRFTNIIPTSIDVMKNSVSLGIPTNIFTVHVDQSVLPVERFSSISAPIQLEDNSNQPIARCIKEDGGIFRIRMQGTGASVKIS